MRLPRTKLLDRRVNVRDAPLFVIATEGAETENQYFEGFNCSRVRVEILRTESGKSSPEQVLNRLEEFKTKYDFGDGDEFWIVIDVDRWPHHKLNAVCREAQNRFQMAVSNPCFEFWLYLHFADHDLNTPEWQALVTQNKGAVSKAMEARLRQRLAEKGGFQKANLKFARFRPYVADAISRARALDIDKSERWPQTFPGTHVYRLVERLLKFLPQG